MRTLIFFFAITPTLFVSGCSSPKAKSISVRLGGLDYSWWDQVKVDLINDEITFLPAFFQLMKDADEALVGGV